jgi:signal transduction histidine kinase
LRSRLDIAAAVGRHVQVHTTAGQPPDRFFVRIRPDLPALWADPDKIDQVINNLVENALRHGAGAVRMWTRHDDGRIEIHVSDDGGGFPAEFLPHAFERFRRADTARSGDGTGLGLAIVEAIASAHGGAVGAANRDGGADVWIAVAVATPPNGSEGTQTAEPA